MSITRRSDAGGVDGVEMDSIMTIRAPWIVCHCGCGQKCRAWSGYAKGHRPDIVDYREFNKERWHRTRAARALGKPLPPRAVVHHVDGTKSDASALVICQDQAYHLLLHKRQRILQRGGDPDRDSWCGGCRRPVPNELFWKSPRDTRHYRAGTIVGVCRNCQSRKRAARRVAASQLSD